jgi:putative ABC transport system ATP-binding protein
MTEPLIRLRGVSRLFRAPGEVTALDAVDLDIGRGEYVSVVGASGSGKSTLLNVLGLLDSPTSGEYELASVATSRLDARERAEMRARSIGFVFQSFHLMAARSVLENVKVGMLYNRVPRAERDDRAREVLDRLGLSHRLDFRPPLLSGGERQRVAVARAIACAPDVLLADEPTGNLDAATTDEVLRIFDELHRDGLTLMVITHDERVAARATRGVRIAGGRVEAA